MSQDQFNSIKYNKTDLTKQKHAEVRIPVKVTSDSGLYVSTDRSVATLAIVFI